MASGRLRRRLLDDEILTDVRSRLIRSSWSVFTVSARSRSVAEAAAVARRSKTHGVEISVPYLNLATLITTRCKTVANLTN